MPVDTDHKLLEKTCRNLRSVLLSEKNGVDMDRLSREYREMVGEDIPFRRLSCTSLDAFLTSIPSVCWLSCGVVRGVASEATEHIKDMVNKQNSKSKKGGRRRPAHRIGGPIGPPGMGRRFGGYKNIGGFSDDEDGWDSFGCGSFDVVGGTTSGRVVPGGYETDRSEEKPALSVKSETERYIERNGGKMTEIGRNVIKTGNSLSITIASKSCNVSGMKNEDLNDVITDISVYEERVKDFLSGRPHGLFVTQVEKMYVKKFEESLPSDWCHSLGKKGCLTVNSNICTLVNVTQSQSSVSSPFYPTGKSWDIFILTVLPPGDKIVVLDNKFQSQLKSLMSDMQSYYRGPRFVVSLPVLENFYCARVGTEMFRVQLIVRRGDIFTCKLVDLGVNQEVRVTDLLELVPEFCKLPAQAITCHLDLLGTVSCKLESIKDLMEGKNVIGMVTNMCDLGDRVMERGSCPRLVIYDNNGLINLSNKLVNHSNLDKVQTSGQSERNTAGHPYMSMSSLQLALPKPLANSLFQPTCPSNGQYYDVIVCLVITPDRFIVQPYVDRIKYQTMNQEMQTFYNTDTGLGADQLDIPLAVKNGECWYRAVLMRELAEGQAQMKLVDIGNIVLVINIRDQVRPLLAKFAHLPIQGQEASLSGVRPLKDSGWSQGEVTIFRGLVQGKSFVGLVGGIVGEMSLILFDTSKEDVDTVINNEMVTRGIARKVA